jgi:hypothetical protein
VSTDTNAAAAHLDRAIDSERDAHVHILAGNAELAQVAMRRAADFYWSSWQNAPPESVGRLVGMLKAAIIAGDGREAADRLLAELPTPSTPTSAYGCAIAHLVRGDNEGAQALIPMIVEGGTAFQRTAIAVDALASADRQRYAEALGTIVAHFESRPAHLTGVPIADTAIMLEALARPRGMACNPQSRCLPQ